MEEPISPRIPTVAELVQEGTTPEILFWVGCAGSHDTRAQKISRALATILERAGVVFAILGNEEMCSGDPARRAGNEFLFQVLALQNIQTLQRYEITRIVTTCPHCYNTLKNEYSQFGGHFEVLHHTQFMKQLISEGKLHIRGSHLKVTYHDSCYLGRANGVYDVPRELLSDLLADLKEMPRTMQRGLCCGAGGAQMFKEDEPGVKRINTERIEEVMKTGAPAVVANCPFCITMLQDGLKERDAQDAVQVYDLSELIVNNMVI